MRKVSSSSFALALGFQLARGIVGLLAIAAAVWLWGSHQAAPAALGVVLIVVALFAWRGCPACWLSGLAVVIASRGQGRSPAARGQPPAS